MTTESLSIPATSPDPATADAFVTSGIIISRPTSATSTSPPTVVTLPLQHNSGPLAPSDLPNHPSLASHPTLDNTLPTESRRSERVPTVPSASTGPASAPDLGVAAKDDDNRKPDPRKGKNTLDPPSGIHGIHTNAMVTLDPPPQSPSVTGMDTVTTSPSPREPNAERTGDHPPLPLHCPYDIV
ncbi:hypothetical protein EDB87DRAFT_1645108 [Lactarius vividus]|nr:hypothetical protein EDB87DRAFT_1645108 [Lactarius vividus]